MIAKELLKTSLILLCAIVLTSCKIQKHTKKALFNIITSVDSSSVLKNSHVGVYIIDAKTNEIIAEKNAEKFFIPASNVKIFTLYACLKSLKDSIPAIKYVKRGDSLIFWGTSDPTFLHPNFNSSKTLEFLKNNINLYWSNSNFKNPKLGSGWSWDDYNDYYQTEISALPLYANSIKASVLNKKLSIKPHKMTSNFIENKLLKSKSIKRDFSTNKFMYSPDILLNKDFSQEIPFVTSDSLTWALLSDTLKVNVKKTATNLPINYTVIYSNPVDTVYRKMMQESDNMLAEHLLLLAGQTLTDTISSSVSIAKLSKKYFANLPQKQIWVDGSGISRYNLYTPKNIVNVLSKMYSEFPQDRLFSLMSIGGKAGTLANQYKNSDTPYIYAKTGSMSGIYNQSGYLITKSGRMLVFSFMNNNFTESTLKIRNETVKILTSVYENY